MYEEEIQNILDQICNESMRKAQEISKEKIKIDTNHFVISTCNKMKLEKEGEY